MPTYLLSVHHGDDFAFSEGVDPESVFAAVDGFNQDLDRAGALRYAGGLQPASTARTVMADGTVRPGPRIAGEEYLGGFWVIEVADDDAALGVGSPGGRYPLFADCGGPPLPGRLVISGDRRAGC